MGLLELPDLRHTLVDIGTTLLCISGYNGLPGRTLPINLIQIIDRPDGQKEWIMQLCQALFHTMMEMALF